MLSVCIAVYFKIHQKLIVPFSFSKAREVSVMREEQLQVNEIKNEVAKLRGVQHVSKSMSGRIEELEMTIERLTAELSNEKKEREKVVVEKENIKKETHEVDNSSYCFCSLVR